jgi:hypothetical protein
MSKKISSIEIENFRGIPKKLKLDFWNKSFENPCSFIIFGDNGTGKSSIIDGIELGLQARIDRNKSLKSELKASPVSLKNYDTAKISVNFQDKTSIEREINIIDEDDNYIFKLNNQAIVPSYGIAPFVLRRSDILKFIQTPSHQKQVLFFSYIKSIQEDNWSTDKDEESNAKDYEKLQLKNQRREFVEKLANELKIPIEDIALDVSSFNTLILEKIYNGISKPERIKITRKGYELKINNKALEIAKIIQVISEKIQLLNKKVQKEDKSITIQEITQDKLTTIFSDAGKYLTTSFKAISTANFFDRIELRIGDTTKVSFDVIVHLKNGKEIKPNNIFSEANLDLLALLVFLSIIKEASENGQEKVLVLDDVLQSVDSSIRLMFVDFLLKNFSKWQLIFSIHDRLFLNQLKSIFRRHSHEFCEIEILKWDFDNGPFILKKEIGKDNSLATAITTNDINLITSQAGVLLEKICNHLSYSLPISIVRKKEDKYTLGDLWPGVFKKLKKTQISESLETIDKLTFLRNLFGAHYNEWALSLSNSEAFQYANAINNLYENVFCENCLNWIMLTSTNLWRCNCGQCILYTNN